MGGGCYMLKGPRENTDYGHDFLENHSHNIATSYMGYIGTPLNGHSPCQTVKNPLICGRTSTPYNGHVFEWE